MLVDLCSCCVFSRVCLCLVFYVVREGPTYIICICLLITRPEEMKLEGGRCFRKFRIGVLPRRGLNLDSVWG